MGKSWPVQTGQEITVRLYFTKKHFHISSKEVRDEKITEKPGGRFY